MEVRLEGTSSGGGKSAMAVIPSLGSRRYVPGPNIAVSSVLACWGHNYTIQDPSSTIPNPVALLQSLFSAIIRIGKEAALILILSTKSSNSESNGNADYAMVSITPE